MDPFRLISQYFWLLCLGFTGINYVIARRRIEQAKGIGSTYPEAAIPYLRWFWLASGLPWLVMGYGQLTGSTPTVWYYFRPQDHNPFVIGWLACIFMLSVVYAIWVLFFGGARKVQELQLFSTFGMRTKNPLSELMIKLLAAIGPFFVLVWIYLAASMDAPIPRWSHLPPRLTWTRATRRAIPAYRLRAPVGVNVRCHGKWRLQIPYILN